MGKLKTITSGGGGWFKPDDHTDTAALLFEVTGYQAQRPSDYGPKDSIVTTMTVFKTDAAVDALTPTEVKTGHRVEQSILMSTLRDSVGVGGATCVVLAQAPSKKPGQKPAWVWRSTSADTAAKVEQYMEKRDAELQAAVDAAPDFGDDD